MAIILSRGSRCGGAEVLSRILVDGLIALISILFIFLAALPGFSPQGGIGAHLVNGWLYYPLIFGGIILCMLLVIRLENRLLALTDALLGWFPLHSEQVKGDILARFHGLISGLRVIFALRTSLPVLLLSLCTWGCLIALNYCGMIAVMDPPPFRAAVFVTFLAAMGMMLFATPAGVGTVHAASVLALSMFGVSMEKALASAILTHALVTALNIGVGIFSAHRTNFHIRKMFRPS